MLMTTYIYMHAGIRRMTIAAWYALDKWPYPCPTDPYHKHFFIIDGDREYRCGPAIQLPAAQVSALIFIAEHL